MNYEKFKDWFIGLLNNLKEPMTIIMDNAPYHSVQLNKPIQPQKRVGEVAYRKRSYSRYKDVKGGAYCLSPAS